MNGNDVIPLRVGWIGLGIMGSRMAAHLSRAGHELVVYNRTHATADSWAAAHGATAVRTPAEVRADVVFTMLVDGDQVEDALLGPRGAARAARPGTVFVDMSTIAPDAARRIGGHLETFLDAPVTGSAPRAEDASLTIMAGGAVSALERVRPLLRLMGARVVHAGAVGSGQQIKLLNNAIAAANANTLAQALVAGRQAGVDLDAMLEVVGNGSGKSAVLDLKAPAMRRHDFTPLFKLEHMLKDVRLCLESLSSAGATFDAAEQAHDVLIAASRQGLGSMDFVAFIDVLEERAGVRI